MPGYDFLANNVKQYSRNSTPIAPQSIRTKVKLIARSLNLTANKKNDSRFFNASLSLFTRINKQYARKEPNRYKNFS